MKQILKPEILQTPLRNAIYESVRQQPVSYLQTLFFVMNIVLIIWYFMKNLLLSRKRNQPRGLQK